MLKLSVGITGRRWGESFKDGAKNTLDSPSPSKNGWFESNGSTHTLMIKMAKVMYSSSMGYKCRFVKGNFDPSSKTVDMDRFLISSSAEL